MLDVHCTDVLDYRCARCNKGVRTKAILRQHLMSCRKASRVDKTAAKTATSNAYPKEEQYQCLPCNKWFMQKSNLKIHKKFCHSEAPTEQDLASYQNCDLMERYIC